MAFQAIQYRDRWAILEKGQASSAVGDNSLLVPEAKKTVLATIYLPLPSDFASAVAPQWTVQDVPITSAAVEAFSDATAKDAWNARLTELKRFSQNMTAYFTSAYQQKFTNNIANPKKQAFFQGIEPREFTFSWTFSPTSSVEAATITNIVQTFTKWSLPSIGTPNDPYFNFPCEFMITVFKAVGFPVFNESLVITSVNHNPAPAGMQLLTDGHSVQTGLSITMRETTIRTNEFPGV